MISRQSLVFFIIFIIVVFGLTSLFTVKEGERALLLKLGKIVVVKKTDKAWIAEPGLHFKWPFVNQVKKIDIRLHTLDAQSSRILTKEQKYVLVDYYVKWRVADLPVYFTRTEGSSLQAEQLLQQKVNDALRAEFGTHTILEVIADDRENIMNVLRKRANESAANLGLAIVDVRIKRIDLPKEVSQSVFARMRADRERVAAQHRADGKAQAEALRAQADAQATVIVAKAKAASAKLKAKGDKISAGIFADSYNKDAEFYNFYRSVKAYQNTFNNKQSILVLSPNSQFFKYFNRVEK